MNKYTIAEVDPVSHFNPCEIKNSMVSISTLTERLKQEYALKKLYIHKLRIEIEELKQKIDEIELSQEIIQGLGFEKIYLM